MENVITRSCEQFGTIRQIKGDPALWCGSDVAKALGYTNSRKAITDHCRCVTKRYIPHPQSPSKQIEVSFIPEADVYRLICHSKLPKAQEFEKWVFEDVVPKAVRGEPKQMTFDDYSYFDKTFNGEPVVTVHDIAYMTGINRTTISETICRELADHVEYGLLEKEPLAQFKRENPKVPKNIPSLIIVNRRGFEALCKIYSLEIEKPKCFAIEDKKRPMQFITPEITRQSEEIRRMAERLIHLTYLLDDTHGQVLCGETFYQCKMAVIRQMKEIGSCIVIPRKVTK